MAFSDAFARGYAIGDAAKKRKAVAKYFEKFEEMTKDDSEPAAEEIGGISVPDSVITERGALDIQPLSEVEPPAVDAAGAIDARSPSAKRMAPAPTPPASALDLGGDPAAVTAETPAASVDAPRAIPIGKKATKFHKSLTQGDIKNLDKLALEAARASGDLEVFNALKKTGDSFLQGKVLSNLGMAQTALTNGDTEQADIYLRKAYRYVPDGQELKIQRDRKTGMLTIKNPADGKPIELTPERIGNFATMLRDPEEWAKLTRQEAKDVAAAKMEERRLVVAEKQLAEQVRSNGVRELMDTKKFDQDTANSVFDNLYKAALAGKAYAESAAEGKAGGMKPDDARQYGLAVGGEVEGFLMPRAPADPNDPLAKPQIGPPPAGYELFARPDGSGLTVHGMQAKELGGALGIANPDLGPAVAARAGMEMTLALTQSGTKMGVNPAGGTVTLMISGRPTQLKAPPELIKALIAVKKSQDEFEASSKGSASWRYTG